MFDVGWSELVVIGVVALVVIGPKELPGVLRTVGKAVNKLRVMAGEFRGQFDDAMREAELHDVKKDFTDLTNAANSAIADAGNPLGSIRDEVQGAVEGKPPADAMTTPVTPIDVPAEPLPLSPALAQVEADAKALEAEPEKPKPRARRKKTDETGETA
jgi:sec-independent protein translocase protein TatB